MFTLESKYAMKCIAEIPKRKKKQRTVRVSSRHPLDAVGNKFYNEKKNFGLLKVYSKFRSRALLSQLYFVAINRVSIPDVQKKSYHFGVFIYDRLDSVLFLWIPFISN